MHQFTEKADWTRADALRLWKGFDLVKNLRTGNFAAIADNMVDAFDNALTQSLDLRAQDRAPALAQVKKMRAAFAAGVAEGKTDLWTLLQRGTEATADIAGHDTREQIAGAIKARLTFLFT